MSNLNSRIESLKKGDLLWSIKYWGGARREIRKLKIKKMTNERIYFENLGFSIKKEEIFLNQYFFTLREALIYKIKLHEAEVKRVEKTINFLKKEIDYLTLRFTKEVKANQNND